MPNNKLAQVMSFARMSHEWQKRASGLDYITNPIAVASMALEFKLPNVDIAVALLHDSVEDTSVTLNELEEQFWIYVKDCIYYLTKESGFRTKKERLKNYLKKLEEWFTYSCSVLIIKLLDVMHNMETVHNLSIEKQKQQTLEVKDFYLPLFYRNILKIPKRFKSNVFNAIFKIEIICNTIHGEK